MAEHRGLPGFQVNRPRSIRFEANPITNLESVKIL